MYVSPQFAARGQVLRNLPAKFIEMGEVPIPRTVPKLNRPLRTIQPEPGLATLPEGMHMRRGMIVRVYSHPITPPAGESSCHAELIPET
jgi:hypothetical protein